jgi:glycosyltransferase involved in cell wall biosynthesis
MNCCVLYLIGELHTGGSERQLWYLLRAMDRERYKPAVAVWNYCEGDIYAARVRALGVPLYVFPKDQSRVAKLRAFRGLIKRLQPEVVHSWSFYTNFAAYWAARETSAVSVGSIRSDFLRAVKGCGMLLGRLSARWPSHQICNSFAAAETVRKLKGKFFVPAQCSVVFNGIDLSEFRAIPLPSPATMQILGVGYLIPVKRWDRVLGAVQRLKQRGINCLVQIAGDGPLQSNLERYAEDLGIAGHVKFLGHVNDVPDLLVKASFVVHTADSEGCPNAIMEAMACGRAVVGTDAGDIPFLIKHGKTGFVVPRGDTAKLAAYMERLILDPGLCRRMGQAAHAMAESTFGWERLVRETFDVYRAAGWRDLRTL